MSKLIALTSIQRAVAAAMFNDVTQYQARIEELNNQMRTAFDDAQDIQNKALAENRDLNKDEEGTFNELMNSIEGHKKEIKRLEAMLDNASFLRETVNNSSRPQPNLPDDNGAGSGGSPAGGTNNRNDRGYQVPDGTRIQTLENRGTFGFRHMGEFAAAVIHASNKTISPENYDPRIRQIMNAPTSYGQEAVGEDGGVLVPPDYRAEIMKQVMGEDSLLTRCDELITSSNGITVPQDVTTPWGSSGVQAYWEGEADQLAQSKPNLKSAQTRLNKLTVLVPVTEEMLEDSPLMGSYLLSKAPEVIGYKINDAIVNGTGAGQPLGFMNSGALITVAKETSQAADTIVGQNISKMWARMYAPHRRNAIWLINQDIESQLDAMFLPVTNLAGTENVGGFPLYVPAGGLSASPYATLKGRPVIPVQNMQTLGDLGDIALVDLRAYLAATKAGGIRQDVSMHLWFDYDVVAFKFRFRMAGRPWYDSTITPANSSNTLSPFVTLAARG